MENEVIDVEISKISVNPFQPRRNFLQSDLEELAQSIQTVGIIHPPVGRPINGGFEIVSGERRFRAAQLAGLTTIPLMVRKENDIYSAEAALIENIQRVDLNPIEISRALNSLMDDYEYSQEELSKRVGKKRSTVANYLRLITLPKRIQDSVSTGELSMGHAKAILSVDGFEKQLFLHDQIIQNELSVRETEEAAQRLALGKVEKKFKTPLSKDCFLDDLQNRLQKKLGTKVILQTQGKGGKIVIDYYTLDDLDRLLEIIHC